MAFFSLEVKKSYVWKIDQGRMFKVANCDLKRRTRTTFEIHALTSSLKKHTFYNLLINNILYLCVT